MSKAYKDLKVNELKDVLKERGLPTAGNKADLVARLEESDERGTSEGAGGSAGGEAQEGGPDQQVEATEVPSDNAGSSEAVDSEKPQVGAETKSVEAQSEATPEPVPREPTEEELKEQTITDLKTRIARNKKFGVDTGDLETQLRRIERFGAAAVRDAQQKAATAFKSANRRRRKSRRGAKVAA